MELGSWKAQDLLLCDNMTPKVIKFICNMNTLRDNHVNNMGIHFIEENIFSQVGDVGICGL
jgi:hypothetical protein